MKQQQARIMIHAKPLLPGPLVDFIDASKVSRSALNEVEGRYLQYIHDIRNYLAPLHLRIRKNPLHTRIMRQIIRYVDDFSVLFEPLFESEKDEFSISSVRRVLDLAIRRVHRTQAKVRNLSGSVTDRLIAYRLDFLHDMLGNLKIFLEGRDPALVRGHIDPLFILEHATIFVRNQSILSMDVGLKDESAHILVNRQQCMSVIQNLVQNAERAIEGVADPRIILSLRKAGESVLFAVTDNGIGIPPQHLQTIFTPGFTTKQDPGHGQGLAICKQIVESHGGSISVESEVGKGTTFWIAFPLVRKQKARVGENLFQEAQP